jgi:hypothetical protein
LGFLCHRQDALDRYVQANTKQITLVPINLHNLPSPDIATFYKTLLRAFYHARHQFESDLQEEIAQRYLSNADKQDAFLPQSALHDIVFMCQEYGKRIVLVLDYFHHFIQEADPKVINTLRGMRETFKHTLSFIVGMNQEVAYLSAPDQLGEMYELLDRHTCWVGAMTEEDARNLITRATTAVQPPKLEEIATMLRLSGNFPALLKLIAYWWMNPTQPVPTDAWSRILIEQENIQRRMDKIWHALTQEERFVLSELQRQPKRTSKTRAYQTVLQTLEQKGVCRQDEDHWRIAGDLFKRYVKATGPSSLGRIWMDEETQEIWQGGDLISDLTPLEWQLLDYLIQHPRKPHEKSDLIVYLWPDKAEQMTDNDLQQLVYRLRKKVDTSPPRYIITWKGAPGGYQLYPEGHPG